MFPERLRSSPPLASQRVGDPLIMMGMITLMIMVMMVMIMVMMMGMMVMMGMIDKMIITHLFY